MGFFEGRDRGDLGPPPDPFRLEGDGGMRSPVPLKWIGIAAAALVLFIAASVGKSIYVDFLWFDSVDYAGVYRTVVVARIALFALGAVLATLVIGANIWLARRLAPRGFEESFIEEVDPEAIRRIVTILLVAATLFLAVIFGSALAGAWDVILTWLNGVPFGREDAQFGRDVSFYVFDLPAYSFLQGWVLALVIVSALAAGAVYGLAYSLQRFELNITPGMRIHLSVLVGLIFVLIAIATWLGIFDLVASPGGIVYGATYTDVNARLPVRYILVALALFAGVATIANAFLSSGYRLPMFALGVWAFVGIVGGLLYPAAIQSFQVVPNEIELEQRYIARNIEATRLAWGLDTIEETPFPAQQRVSEEELEASQETIENIRLLDPRPLRDTINQVQAIRQFYRFPDIDIDRYTIDGEDQQVLIASRELDLSAVRGTNWTRERLQLTHGFGSVVTPVSRIGSQGLPVFLVQDIPPRSETLEVTEQGSRIYFGELTDHYVIVNSDEPEFDYPLGEGNTSTFYEPEEGIRLSSLLRRTLLAWELGDQNLLISGQINSDSRVLMHRNIQERVRKIAPFLVLDLDPYMVLDEGQMKWVQPAYTVADNFPYAQPRGGVNYIRNSVQVVIDALTGEVDLYLVDPEDPVAATWGSIFPGLFTPLEEMPDSMRAHLRYPLDLFKLQSQLYLRYHIQDPNVFFIGEDIWNIPTERSRGREEPMEPYYVSMRLPGEERLEFVLILPFTPNNRPNTVAWLAGRSDGEQFGKLRAFRFPTGDLVFGPSQIAARIDQDARISQQLTLWDSAGSNVFRGNLLMVPIGESFLYVQPVYLQAETAALPELRRVIVANGNDIAMERTLDRALEVVMGERAPTELEGALATPGGQPAPGTQPTPGAATPAPGTPAPPAPGTPAPPAGDLRELLEQAREASENAQRELDRLRQLLDSIEQTQSQ
jgi:uncharacterized membrane protein (UPF0182 family)